MFTKPCKPCNRPNRQRYIRATLDRFPTGTEAVESILKVYRDATPEEHALGLGLGGYTFSAATYRAAARYLGLKPHELQAITWTVWRRQHSYRGRNADLRHSVHADIF